MLLRNDLGRLTFPMTLEKAAFLEGWPFVFLMSLSLTLTWIGHVNPSAAFSLFLHMWVHETRMSVSQTLGLSVPNYQLEEQWEAESSLRGTGLLSQHNQLFFFSPTWEKGVEQGEGEACGQNLKAWSELREIQLVELMTLVYCPELYVHVFKGWGPHSGPSSQRVSGTRMLG